MLVLALLCLAAGAGCTVTAKKSAYPAQYRAFKEKADSACKDLFAALDAGDRQGVGAAVRRLLSAKAPPDLERRWEIYKSDIRRFFVARKVIADRAAESLDEGSAELGLDDC